MLLPVLLLASCGEPLPDNRGASVASPQPAEVSGAVPASAVPVRIGELGPNFAACGAAGTTRHVAPGASLPLRAAPFDSGAEAGVIASGQRFFVCSRTLDQKWLGVVIHDSGTLSPECGVSGPAPSRGAYQGPCRSGWVASAFVQLIAGLEQAPTPANEAAGAAEGA